MLSSSHFPFFLVFFSSDMTRGFSRAGMACSCLDDTTSITTIHTCTSSNQTHEITSFNAGSKNELGQPTTSFSCQPLSAICSLSFHLQPDRHQLRSKTDGNSTAVLLSNSLQGNRNLSGEHEKDFLTYVIAITASSGVQGVVFFKPYWIL